MMEIIQIATELDLPIHKKRGNGEMRNINTTDNKAGRTISCRRLQRAHFAVKTTGRSRRHLAVRLLG